VNKSEFVAAVAENLGSTKAEAARAVEAVLTTIKQTLKTKLSIRLISFGTFKVTHVEAKTVRNPQNGSLVKVPAAYRPKFVPGKELKELVNHK
jgi:DNA-binding protein HU-beta